MNLGGQYDPLPVFLGQRFAHNLFGFAERVDIGGVDEIDPGIEGAVDDANCFVVVRGAPRPEHHGAQAERAHFDTGAAERAIFHLADGSHGPGQSKGDPPQSRSRADASSAANSRAGSLVRA
jgi:hypothetical protein